MMEKLYNISWSEIFDDLTSLWRDEFIKKHAKYDDWRKIIKEAKNNDNIINELANNDLK